MLCHIGSGVFPLLVDGSLCSTSALLYVVGSQIEGVDGCVGCRGVVA